MKKILLYTSFASSASLLPFVVFGQITNPLKDEFSTLPAFLNALLDIVILIAVPIIVVMIIYSGFLFVSAAGKPEKLNTAKKAILWTLIGAMILLGAKALSTGIEGTVDELTSEITEIIV